MEIELGTNIKDNIKTSIKDDVVFRIWSYIKNNTSEDIYFGWDKTSDFWPNIDNIANTIGASISIISLQTQKIIKEQILNEEI